MAILTTRTKCTGPSAVASTHAAHTAPIWAAQGTSVSFAGTSVPFAGTSVLADAVLPFAQVAVGARVASLPGLPPRDAPV